MQKSLMQMNVQLHHVVTDITGATSMRIIRATIAGERDPAVLAVHRDRRCHATVEVISAALTGNWRDEHVFALGQARWSFMTLTKPSLPILTRRSRRC
jgi:transposase